MITDTEARRIADQWHGGGGTALYAFASTGAIDTARADHSIWLEITNTLNDIENAGEYADADRHVNELFELRNYIMHHETRGPVPGWADLTWQSPRKDTTMDANTVRRIFFDAGLAYAASNAGSDGQYDTADEYARQIIRELDKQLAPTSESSLLGLALDDLKAITEHSLSWWAKIYAKAIDLFDAEDHVAYDTLCLDVYEGNGDRYQ